MKKKKRPITLIEVLLSFSLIAIIVGSLLMYLRRVIFLQTKLQTVERNVLSRAHIQQQLHSLFSRIEYGEGTEFFTMEGEKAPELHFYFDNKVDMDRFFSGTVKGIIRRRGDELLVEIRPLTTDQVSREWVIAKGVVSLTWDFISFSEKSHDRIPLWPRGSSSYPDIFVLIVKMNGSIHEFPIFLFKDFSGIPYWKKGESL